MVVAIANNLAITYVKIHANTYIINSYDTIFCCYSHSLSRLFSMVLKNVNNVFTNKRGSIPPTYFDKCCGKELQKLIRKVLYNTSYLIQ